jgi:hypothetical protein
MNEQDRWGLGMNHIEPTRKPMTVVKPALGTNICDFLTDQRVFASKAEARRVCETGNLTVNGEPVSSDFLLDEINWYGSPVVVKKGRYQTYEFSVL